MLHSSRDTTSLTTKKSSNGTIGGASYIVVFICYFEFGALLLAMVVQGVLHFPCHCCSRWFSLSASVFRSFCR